MLNLNLQDLVFRAVELFTVSLFFYQDQKLVFKIHFGLIESLYPYHRSQKSLTYCINFL